MGRYPFLRESDDYLDTLCMSDGLKLRDCQAARRPPGLMPADFRLLHTACDG